MGASCRLADRVENVTADAPRSESTGPKIAASTPSSSKSSSACDRGAELVLWRSAYSGFTELQAFALLHHHYIVTSALTGDSVLYDITGASALDQRGRAASPSSLFGTVELQRI
jgi:hypothetical protein